MVKSAILYRHRRTTPRRRYTGSVSSHAHSRERGLFESQPRALLDSPASFRSDGIRVTGATRFRICHHCWPEPLQFWYNTSETIIQRWEKPTTGIQVPFIWRLDQAYPEKGANRLLSPDRRFLRYYDRIIWIDWDRGLSPAISQHSPVSSSSSPGVEHDLKKQTLCHESGRHACDWCLILEYYRNCAHLWYFSWL